MGARPGWTFVRRKEGVFYVPLHHLLHSPVQLNIYLITEIGTRLFSQVVMVLDSQPRDPGSNPAGNLKNI